MDSSFIKRVVKYSLVHCFVVSTAFGQIPIPYEPHFHQITTKEGLNSNIVESIQRDQKGYTWIGTNLGLQKYDAYEFENFAHKKNDSTSLPSDIIVGIFVDSKNKTWVATLYGVCIYNALNRSFVHIPFAWDKKYRTLEHCSFYEDVNNKIWIIGRMDGHNALFQYDDSKGVLKSYKEFLPSFDKEIGVINEDKTRGNLWLGTKTGLAYYNNDKRRYSYYGSNADHIPALDHAGLASAIFAMMISSSGDLLIITWGVDGYRSFYCINKNGEIVINKPLPLLPETMFIDKEGVLWIGGNGLLKFNRDTNDFELIPLPYKTTLINSICEDSESNLWLSTSNQGIYIFDPHENLVSVTENNGDLNAIGEEEIISTFKTSDEYIITSAWKDNGCYFFNKLFEEVPRFANFNNERRLPVYCILEDRKGDLWAGALMGDVYRIDRKRQGTKKYHDPIFNNQTIRSIVEDRIGNLWFGTQHGLVIKWERQANKFKKVLSNDSYGIIYGLYCDVNNQIWVGTMRMGLLKIKDDQLAKTFVPNMNTTSISDFTINSIKTINDTTLIIATPLGLNSLNLKDESFNLVSNLKGIQNIDLVSGGASYIVSTREGLYKISNNGEFRPIQTSTMRVFSLNASMQLANGILYGTETGIVYLNLVEKKTIAPTSVEITSLKIFNHELNVDSLFESAGSLIVAQDQNHFTIKYSSLRHDDNARVKYKYKMEGYDDEWVDSNDQRSVSYGGLPSGHYTFRLKCLYSDNQESPETLLLIYIQPPFWATWWFISGSTLIIGVVVYWLYRQRVNKIKYLAEVRGRISADLHDDMGSSLSTINVLAGVAKNQAISNPENTQDLLQKISSISTQVMETMDEIVWSVNPLNDSFNSLTSYMRFFGSSLLEPKGISFSFSVDEKLNKKALSLGVRHDLYLIYKEAINNAVKYSGCSSIQAAIFFDEGRIHMSIQDDGQGIEWKKLESGDGLRNMKKRATRLNGEIKIDTDLNKGTIIHVSFSL